jgi:hypothetical protein
MCIEDLLSIISLVVDMIDMLRLEIQECCFG